MYDQYDNLLDGTNGYQDAYKYVWRIKFYELRSSTHLDEELEFSFDVIGQEYFEVERVQEHSPLIAGTFMMDIAQETISYNNSPNIPYDISASALQAAIRLHPAFAKFRVERKDDPKYGATWYIHYDEFHIDLP